MTQTTPSPNRRRRPDRVDAAEKWIKTFLHCAPFGILATAGDGQPFVYANLFAYDEAAHAIYYLHTATEGHTRARVEDGQKVCFTVGEMGRILPADTAAAFSIEYASVTVCGRISIIEDAEQTRSAVRMLFDKYAPHLCPGQDYQPISAEEIEDTDIFCIQINSWRGKKNEAPADFPRAYHLVEQPMLPSNYWRGFHEI